MRAILQAISLPSRSVKKNLEAAERQFQSKGSFPAPVTFPFSLPLLSVSCSNHPCSLFVERKPGDIEGITDIFFEDFKNFPQVRELGEESARFVREEMENTWGDSRLAVLSEDEAQRWILGVSLHFSFLGLGLLVLAKL